MDTVLSIIIPYYCTSGSLFFKCMDSILLCQSRNIEVIVINDGSPEEYDSVVMKYSDDDRVKIIKTTNNGVSAARNTGVSLAMGKWLMFVDSDDYINTQNLEYIISYEDEFKYDVVIFNGCGDTNGILRENTMFLQEGTDYSKNKADLLSVLESAITVGILPKGYIQCFSLGAPYCKLIQTSFLKSNNIFFNSDVRFAEDTLFSVDLFSKAKGITYIDKILYYYVKNPNSVTSKCRLGLSNDMDVFFEKLQNCIINYGYDKSLERAFYTRVQFEIGRCFNNEFFHPDSKGVTKKDYQNFISKEPYCTAIRLDYLESHGIMASIRKNLIVHGHGYIYKYWKKVKNILIGRRRKK